MGAEAILKNKLIQFIMIKTTLKLLQILLLGAALCSSALAADSDAVQGKWKADKEFDGQKATFNLEIKADTFNFEMKGSDGATRFILKGKIKLEKQGAFKTMTLHDIKGGESEADLNSMEDVRSFVYVTGWKSLTLAGNFDRERDNEEPNLTVYRKE